MVDHGSFSDAAQTLWCSQSAVSQQIQALERKLGSELIVRGTRPVQPTLVGKLLVDRAREILQQLYDAEQDAVRAGRGQQRLRLATFASASAVLVQTTLAHADHSRQLDMVVSDPPHSLSALLSRAVDLALIFDYGKSGPLPAGASTRQVATEPMLVAMSSAHWAARAADVSLMQLRTARWVAGRNPMCQDALAAACVSVGFEPRIVHETDDYEAALAVVTTSDCVALVPRMVARDLPPGLRAVAMPQLPRRTVRLAWASARQDLEPTADMARDLHSLIVGPAPPDESQP